MSAVLECDICIIGGGISAALIAQKLSEERDAEILVVEAGRKIFNFEDRFRHRQRYLNYGENPWPDDFIPDQIAQGSVSPTMALGGWALRWGGITPRFSPEDFRLQTLYGIGDDWPITYADLEPFYAEAERRIGVAGEAGPPDLDPRFDPYPMPPLPLNYNLNLLKSWSESAGIPVISTPSAKNSVRYQGRPACGRCDTCLICPLGARYSPDFTFRELLSEQRIRLITQTLVRRLNLGESSARIESAWAVNPNSPEESLELRAKVFVLAAGYTWSSHLLLLSAHDSFPAGVANRSGLVGRYMTGHRDMSAIVKLPLRLYPGLNLQHSLYSQKFMRPGSLSSYIRHDFRIWESDLQPELADQNGKRHLGNALLEDWRSRVSEGLARVRAIYDVLPSPESSLTLDSSRRNRWGDPLPKLEFRDSVDSIALRAGTERQINALFDRLAMAGDGQVLERRVGPVLGHPAGGCRMGSDPAQSVCDSFGRTHDHENLFVVGAPTFVSGGCTNSTLTFAALALRSVEAIGEGFALRSG